MLVELRRYFQATSGTCTDAWTFANNFNGPHSIRETCELRPGVVFTYEVNVTRNAAGAFVWMWRRTDAIDLANFDPVCMRLLPILCVVCVVFQLFVCYFPASFHTHAPIALVHIRVGVRRVGKWSCCADFEPQCFVCVDVGLRQDERHGCVGRHVGVGF